MKLRTMFRNAVVLREMAFVALGGLRAHRVRSWLALAGIAVGIAPVLFIVGVMTGVRSAILQDVASVGSGQFTLQRFDRANGESESSGRRPPITAGEAEMLASLSELRSAVPSVDATADLQYAEQLYRDLDVQGTSTDWPDAVTGDFQAGRNFVLEEQARAANVAVVSTALARQLAPDGDAVGETVRLAGIPFRVVGVFREAASLLTDTSAYWIRTPYTSALKYLAAEREWLEVLAVPSDGTMRERAEDAVIARLRASRRLRSGQPNNFVLVGEEGVRELIDRLGGMLFGTMLLLTGLGLVVGGVGVVGIMSISVTERTPEIGIRRALGARRRDIAGQFLFEAVALTVAGGALGLIVGSGATFVLHLTTPVPAMIPLWAIAVTLGMTGVSGIGLGLYPALQAAALDPAEALRRE
jgi:putative ABC transport system permease protein